MKQLHVFLPLLVALAVSSNAMANPVTAKVIPAFASLPGGSGSLVFADDFERFETDDTKEQLGNGWVTNSNKTTKGNKQVDLKDGSMRICISKESEHAVSVDHPAEFRDCFISLSFMLENPKDSLSLNFADLEFKQVHDGHLFVVKISTTKVQLEDLKTGRMDLKIRNASQAKTLSAEQTKMLKTRIVAFPNQLEINKWHTLGLAVDGKKLRLSINGRNIGSLQSEGIAHPTKRTLRLVVPRQAVVDDLKIWQMNLP